MLNVVLNAELGECGARMWNCMAFNLLPNYSDASFTYVSRHSVSYYTFLVAGSLGLAMFDLAFLQAEQL